MWIQWHETCLGVRVKHYSHHRSSRVKVSSFTVYNNTGVRGNSGTFRGHWRWFRSFTAEGVSICFSWTIVGCVSFRNSRSFWWKPQISAEMSERYQMVSIFQKCWPEKMEHITNHRWWMKTALSDLWCTSWPPLTPGSVWPWWCASVTLRITSKVSTPPESWSLGEVITVKTSEHDKTQNLTENDKTLCKTTKRNTTKRQGTRCVLSDSLTSHNATKCDKKSRNMTKCQNMIKSNTSSRKMTKCNVRRQNTTTDNRMQNKNRSCVTQRHVATCATARVCLCVKMLETKMKKHDKTAASLFCVLTFHTCGKSHVETYQVQISPVQLWRYTQTVYMQNEKHCYDIVYSMNVRCYHMLSVWSHLLLIFMTLTCVDSSQTVDRSLNI